MNCPNCQYKWCRICGFEADYNDKENFYFHNLWGIHCFFISVCNECPWYVAIPYGIFFIIIAPYLMFITLLPQMLKYMFITKGTEEKTCLKRYLNPDYTHRSVCRRGYKRVIYTFFVCWPFWGIVLFTCFALSIILTVVGIVFLYIFIFYLYVRMIQ